MKSRQIWFNLEFYRAVCGCGTSVLVETQIANEWAYSNSQWKSIYRFLILPLFTYIVTIWGQVCETYLNKLLVLQTRVIWFIYFADRKHTLFHFFIDAQILPLYLLYHRSLAIHMHDINTHTAPPKLLKMFDMFFTIVVNLSEGTSRNFRWDIISSWDALCTLEMYLILIDVFHFNP